jgi:hypothetical protein
MTDQDKLLIKIASVTLIFRFLSNNQLIALTQLIEIPKIEPFHNL